MSVQTVGAGQRRDCRCPRARHKHGSLGAYRTDRCRCFPCRLARATKRLEGSQSDDVLVSSIGVQRRLQALACLGWGTYRLGRELGVSNTAVEFWRSGRYPTVRPETVLKVAAVYDRLWDKPAPVTGGRPATKPLAQRLGWLPPLAWDDDTIDDPAALPEVAHTDGIDEVAVDRAIAGQPPATLTRAERELAVHRLTSAGLSARQIADRVRVTSRQIQRDRSAA